MNIELTPHQRELLAKLVDEALEDINPEIHHTRTTEYRTELRDQRRELLKIREALALVGESTDR